MLVGALQWPDRGGYTDSASGDAHQKKQYSKLTI